MVTLLVLSEADASADEPSGRDTTAVGGSSMDRTVGGDRDDPRIIGLPLDAFGLGIAALTALIGITQMRDSRRQRQLSELQSQREIGQVWQANRPGWVAATMLIRGTKSYYALADPTVEQKVRNFEKVRTGYFSEPPTHSWDDWNTARKPVEQQVRATLTALDGVAVSVIGGRLPVAVVYDVIGPDYLRSGAVVRALVGWAFASGVAHPPAIDDNVWRELTEPHEITGWTTYYPGIRLRLLVLLDLLWAEAARRADLSTLDLVEISRLKRKGSGRRNRRRVRKAFRSVNGFRPGVSGLRLRWLLTWADYPRAPITDRPYFDPASPKDLKGSNGAGVRGFVRRLWALAVGGLRRRGLRTWTYEPRPPWT